MVNKNLISLLKAGAQGIYSRLPDRLAASASEVVYRMSARPRVYLDEQRHPKNGLKRGSVTFSIDFEMAWAWQYQKFPRESFVSKGLREREQVPKILAKFNEYDIGATWATVGHLFLRSCVRGGNGLAHSEIARIPHFENRSWRFASGDWFQYDPCSSAKEDPAWYAPDLIEAIVSSKCQHELACHGFSHVGFGPYCPPAVSASELDACIEAMKPYRLRPTSLVFPGNDVGKLDVISKKGFRAVRAFPIANADITLPMRQYNGLWYVPASMPVESRIGRWNLDQRLSRLQQYVKKASETRMNAHVWFHPSLLPIQMERVLFPFLRFCADMRHKGLIDILTMDQLVERTEEAFS